MVQLSLGITYTVTKEIEITVRLRQFLYNTSAFDFALKLFPKGVSQPSQDDLVLARSTSFLKIDGQGGDMLRLVFVVPDNMKDKCPMSAEFIFISRTIINENLGEYWPHQNGQHQYLAYKFRATDRIEGMTMNTGTGAVHIDLDDQLLERTYQVIFGDHLKVGTEMELFSPTTWQR